MNKCSGKFPVAPVAGCSRASFFAAIFAGANDLSGRGQFLATDVSQADQDDYDQKWLYW